MPVSVTPPGRALPSTGKSCKALGGCGSCPIVEEMRPKGDGPAPRTIGHALRPRSGRARRFMKLMAIGFPKSGTTSLTKALNASGVPCAHWRTHAGKFVGVQIYAAVYHGLEPFALLEGHEAVTQADVCLPSKRLNLWPNLDFSVLSAIRRAHPSCLLLLNYRRPEAIADSIARWDDLQGRIAISQIPGLPRGLGRKREHLITWIENHFDACRRFFAHDEHFLEIDIESPDAPERLAKALGIEIVGWGDHKARTLEDELAELDPSEVGLY